MAYDKNVFIFGAGASVAAGAPILSDYMSKARQLLDNHEYSGLGKDPEDKKAFETVFEWRSNRYGVLRRLNVDFDNLEDVFSLVDMAQQFGMKQAKKVRKALIRLACRTIELSVTVPGYDDPKKPYTGDPEYVKLALWIKERRQRQIDNNGPPMEDSIITLNYDTLVEQALNTVIHNRVANYGEPWHTPIPNTYQFKVLKLHGSINWATCSYSNCNYTWAEAEISSFSTAQQDVFRMHPSKNIYGIRCSKCKKGVLEPFIVPPTWNKGSYSKPLEQVWKAAFEEIKEAAHIIIRLMWGFR